MTRGPTTRLRATTRTLPGVALGLALVVQGCAGLIPGKESATADVPGGDGAFQVKKGRPGVVIGAPPGGSDADTDAMARDLAGLTGFGLVVSRGPAARQASVFVTTDDSRVALSVSRAYRRHVADAAQGPLRLYVEVQGADRGSAGRLQIVALGFSADDAWRLRTLYELVRDARVENPVPRLAALVESRPVARDAGATNEGLTASRTLHIDVPRAAKTTYREVYVNVLAAFLTESATFVAARER